MAVPGECIGSGLAAGVAVVTQPRDTPSQCGAGSACVVEVRELVLDRESLLPDVSTPQLRAWHGVELRET